jgi:hypothetical protein
MEKLTNHSSPPSQSMVISQNAISKPSKGKSSPVTNGEFINHEICQLFKMYAKQTIPLTYQFMNLKDRIQTYLPPMPNRLECYTNCAQAYIVGNCLFIFDQHTFKLSSFANLESWNAINKYQRNFIIRNNQLSFQIVNSFWQATNYLSKLAKLNLSPPPTEIKLTFILWLDDSQFLPTDQVPRPILVVATSNDLSFNHDSRLNNWNITIHDPRGQIHETDDSVIIFKHCLKVAFVNYSFAIPEANSSPSTNLFSLGTSQLSIVQYLQNLFDYHLTAAQSLKGQSNSKPVLPLANKRKHNCLEESEQSPTLNVLQIPAATNELDHNLNNYLPTKKVHPDEAVSPSLLLNSMLEQFNSSPTASTKNTPTPEVTSPNLAQPTTLEQHSNIQLAEVNQLIQTVEVIAPNPTLEESWNSKKIQQNWLSKCLPIQSKLQVQAVNQQLELKAENFPTWKTCVDKSEIELLSIAPAQITYRHPSVLLLKAAGLEQIMCVNVAKLLKQEIIRLIHIELNSPELNEINHIIHACLLEEIQTVITKGKSSPQIIMLTSLSPITNLPQVESYYVNYDLSAKIISIVNITLNPTINIQPQLLLASPALSGISLRYHQRKDSWTSISPYLNLFANYKLVLNLIYTNQALEHITSLNPRVDLSPYIYSTLYPPALINTLPEQTLRVKLADELFLIAKTNDQAKFEQILTNEIIKFIHNPNVAKLSLANSSYALQLELNQEIRKLANKTTSNKAESQV